MDEELVDEIIEKNKKKVWRKDDVAPENATNCKIISSDHEQMDAT